MSSNTCKCGGPPDVQDTAGNWYCETCALELWESSPDTFVISREFVLRVMAKSNKDKIPITTNKVPKEIKDAAQDDPDSQS
ncbi:MAG: hypothetical protein N2C14_08335 [Planctomycetales bacterium]